MNRRSILEVVLASASLPGVFPSSIVLGLPAIDGGWCDNSPLAPLLNGLDADLDIIFILHLEQNPLNPLASRFSLLQGLGGRNPFDFRYASGSLNRPAIASQLWFFHQRIQELRQQRRRRVPGGADDQVKNEAVKTGSCGPILRTPPLIVPVVPSVSLGGFLDGRLAFSAGKAKKLIALGEQDMNQALKDLHAKAAGGSA
jgi:hypothetical protein